MESMTLEKKVPGTDPKAGDQFGRLWTYQTCTEFGWLLGLRSGRGETGGAESGAGCRIAREKQA